MLNECENFARQATINLNESDSVHHPKSVGHFLRERFQKYIETIDSKCDQKIARDLFDWHLRFQIIDNSCLSLDQLSAKYWGKYSFNGESCQAHYNFKNGFGSLVNCLINDLNDKSILYNKEVIEIQIHDNRIEPNNNDVEYQHNRNEANISVKCADGSIYTADHVLVTFSLGVLKANKDLFQPHLPLQIRLAIESIGFETINKIFLEFESAWWNDSDGIQFIYRQNDDIDKNQKNNFSWTRYITGFDVMKPNYPNVLLGWVGGNGAIEMEKLSDAEIINDCVELLTKFTNINVPYPIRYYW